MIIDMKYHIASLVAVFLALGIGILVGSTVLGTDVNDVIIDQQKKIVDDLNKSLDQIRKDNMMARDEIAHYKAALSVSEKFEKQVLPLLIEGKLSGKKIAIVQTSDYETPDDWINSLRNAGAEITSVTTVLEGFDLSRGGNESKINEITTKLMLDDKSGPAVMKEVANELAIGILSAQNIENLHYFEQQGMIKTSGEYGVPLHAVIFVGGSQENPGERYNNLDIPMMNYFISKNVPVYGVETTDVAYSYMKQYQKLNISTVDNIDTVPGQLSLVMAVAGKPGHYGIKSTAEHPLPALP